MIERKLSSRLKYMSRKMPVLSVTGPRQSGKTTLIKQCFPTHEYMNFELPDILDQAMSDPLNFLRASRRGMILDEVQKFPGIFSYLQVICDEQNMPGQFILTGSENFSLSEKISQSLAGRIFITNLLPFSLAELKGSIYMPSHPEKSLFTGFYPRIYDKNIAPGLFYPSYIQTYTERDVRQIVNVGNLHTFQKFMRLAAGRVGQLLNFYAISVELGTDLKTVKSWFGILEASFIVFFLRPHHKNYKKRLVKTPKLYFYDTGLVCSLLGIRSSRELRLHWAKGALFENMIIADMMKNYFHSARFPSLYFWRDNTGNEIDCLSDEGNHIKTVEIKSSSVVRADFFRNLNYYSALSKKKTDSYLVYSGDRSYTRSGTRAVSWRDTAEITEPFPLL